MIKTIAYRLTGRARRLVARFRADRAGNVAMMFGLAAIPFFTMGGFAVDFSRAMMVKDRLGAALDATALAIGGQLGLSDEEIRTSANAYFNANYSADFIGVASPITIQSDSSTVTMSASATLDMIFAKLVSVDTMTVSASVEVKRETKGLEVALVLDTTGSMAGAKIAALKTAAADLIKILFGAEQFPEKLKVGVVPFSAAVRLHDPSVAVAKGWIDTTGQSSVAKLNFSSRYAWDIYAPLNGSARQSHQIRAKWLGCIEARPGGLEATDTAPTSASPDTRWVPFFAPDEPTITSSWGSSEPGSGNWANSYITNDSSTGDWAARLKSVTKYANANTTGQNRECYAQPILPLTNDRAAIEAKISALSANGYTHIPIGLGWGWRVLSPTEPYTEGVPYDQEDYNKALILMSDGANTVDRGNSRNNGTTSKPRAGSTYTAYGYLYQGRLGTTNATTAVTRMNTQTTDQCDAIKAAGIRVYTILLMEDDAATRTMMRNCASDPSLFFDTPSEAQLQAVFRAIGADLSNLRISR